VRSGAWFRYGELQLGQGREKTKSYLEENPALLEELRTKILAAGNPVAAASAAGDDEGGGATEE
ncbi:MAG TPA: DNA recombination/repair protein RecA, partial [Pirellulales bacterium]|nr:DNA recombination/repair protein RecA [Pirellulales bacterium]